MKIIATIEARLNSTRLPKKHLLKFRNKYVIEYLIDRLKKLKNIDQIVLATTKNKIDDKLIEIAKKNKICFFRGSEENVLERVYLSSKKFSADAIVQVSGDCPLIDYSLLDQQILIFKFNKPDVVNEYWGQFPSGVTAPIIGTKALEKSLKNAKNKNDLEHVTNYIFRNQKLFKIIFFPAVKANYGPDVEFLLDEYEDFILIKELLKIDKKNIFRCSELLDIIKNKKILKSINKKIKRKNTFKKFIDIAEKNEKKY